MFVYAVLFLTTTPVYFVIFLCLFRLRLKVTMFKSTFYAVLIQHNIADLLSLVLYSICRWAFVVTPHIIYDNPQLGIASIYYNGLYWAIISRSNGIVLMTLHRYLILVKPVHRITYMIQHAEPYHVCIVYWVPSLVFSAIIFSDTGIIFDRPDNMALLMDSDIISKDSIVKTRKYYPIVYGTLSFIGPFTILIFNKDFSRRVRLMLLGQERAAQSESSVGSTLKPNVIVTSRM
ncbi:unnamed protein product [Caenorhabditis brenneri]